MKQFTAMVKARNMEFIRDKGTFFWNLIFPILLVFGFAIAFSSDNEQIFKVGYVGEFNESVNEEFLTLKQVEFIQYKETEGIVLSDILEKVRFHKIDMLIDFNTQEYYLNSQSANSIILGKLINSNTEVSVINSNFTEKQVDGRPIRRVDWLVPGVIGLNMLFSCLMGVGFVIVRYRKNGVLKRLKATPVRPFSFVTAQMASRFIIVALTSVFVFTGTNIFLKFMMLGSYFNLILVTFLAILCMISLGLVFAARIKTEELAGGLLNLISFPMMIFSGVFFSLEGAPKVMQTISKVFPLTHFIESARKIMLEGAGFITILPNVLMLAGMTVVFLIVASLTFRWD